VRPTRGIVVAAGLLLIVAGSRSGGVRAQDQAANPKFEVASVKQNRTGANTVMLGGGPGGRYNASNVPLRLLIRSAYQIQDSQLVGGPDWINTDRFDIVAKAETEPPPTPPGQVGPMQLMVRALLVDRFRLVVHREMREMPIFALVLAREDKRLGPQLKVSSVDCSPAGRRGLPPAAPPGPNERPPCGMRMAPGSILSGGTALSQLATTLSNSVGRTVVDKTGLTDRFDIDLKWTPDGMAAGGGLGIPGGAPPPPPADTSGPSIYAALQEQLGLKLESQRGPVEVLVIDSVEHPTEN